MKKKLLVFITALALLMSMAIPAFASESYGYGVSASDSSSAVIAQSIYDTYGIEAFLIVDNDNSDDNGSVDLAKNAVGNLAKGDNVIIFSITATEYYLYRTGTAQNYSFSAGELYSNLKEYDTPGQYEMATVTFLNDVNLVLAGGSTSTSSTGNPYNTPVSDGSRLVDDADLLTDSEEAELLAKLDEISERQQFDVVVVTTKSLDGKSSMAYADDYYDYNGYGFGENHDGCLLLICDAGGVGNRDWWISTTGYGITALTDAGIDYIGEEVVSYLKNDNWSGGFNKFAELVDDFVTQAKEGKPYDVGNMPLSAGAVLKGLGGSLVVALIIAAIVCLKIKSNYKPVKFQKHATDYLVQGSLMMTGSYDNFITSSVTQTRIESSSSGGGSSTHSGSSGTSHGGGGGKF